MVKTGLTREDSNARRNALDDFHISSTTLIGPAPGQGRQIMQRDGKKFALSAQCIGGSQGVATILKAA